MHYKNSRRDDIIKACKYHYRKASDVDNCTLVMRVIGAHNGIKNLSPYDACWVMNSEFSDTLFTDKTIPKILDELRMNDMLGKLSGLDNSLPAQDVCRLIFRVMVNIVCHSLPGDMDTESLPENDPQLELDLADENW